MKENTLTVDSESSSNKIELEDDHLTDIEIEQFKKKLLQKKREILDETRSIIASEKVHLDKSETKDDLDVASVSVQQDLTFRLLDRSRKLLGEVECALTKIDTGDYGYCEGTGEFIPRERLELTPWARHSVAHKELLEIRKRTQPKKQSNRETMAIFPH